jgi:hypothetical protein
MTGTLHDDQYKFYKKKKATWLHMTDSLNLRALLHVIFHCSVLYVYTNPRVNFIRMLPFGCAMLHYVFIH